MKMKKMWAFLAVATVLSATAMTQASLVTFDSNSIRVVTQTATANDQQTATPSPLASFHVDLNLFDSGKPTMAETVVGSVLRANYRGVIAQPILSVFGARWPAVDQLQKETASTVNTRRALVQA